MTGREAEPRSYEFSSEYRDFFFFVKTLHFCSPSRSSSEKRQALHTELDSVQALRGQLEEVLARTRNMAMVLERAATRQPDFGGGDGKGPASGAAGGTVTDAL